MTLQPHYTIYQHEDSDAWVFLSADFCLGESDECWRGWLHGSHKVTGPGAGGWPQSRQPDFGVVCARWGCLADQMDIDRKKPQRWSQTPLSVTILILDRSSVYSTRIACYRLGISWTLRLQTSTAVSVGIVLHCDKHISIFNQFEQCFLSMYFPGELGRVKNFFLVNSLHTGGLLEWTE